MRIKSQLKHSEHSTNGNIFIVAADRNVIVEFGVMIV